MSDLFKGLARVDPERFEYSGLMLVLRGPHPEVADGSSWYMPPSSAVLGTILWAIEGRGWSWDAEYDRFGEDDQKYVATVYFRELRDSYQSGPHVSASSGSGLVEAMGRAYIMACEEYDDSGGT